MNTIDAYRVAQEHPDAVRQGQEAMQALLARSATDETFRQKLLTDPHAAVSEFTGQDLPETFNVVFIENKADVTVVLPDAIDPEAELSDEELEAVAGGEVVGTATICLGVATILAGAAGVIALTKS